MRPMGDTVEKRWKHTNDDTLDIKHQPTRNEGYAREVLDDQPLPKVFQHERHQVFRPQVAW
jgi:hypothetical protein